MLRQSQIDAVDLKELYELSKIQTDKLLTAEEGCGLFKCGNQFINFDGRIEQGYIYDLADTKPKDHEAISGSAYNFCGEPCRSVLK